MQSGQTSIKEVCDILKAASEAGVMHLSLRKGDFDLEFVLNGDVALTPSSNLYYEDLHKPVDVAGELYHNDTRQEVLPDEPNFSDLALEDPELYEQIMKEQLDV